MHVFSYSLTSSVTINLDTVGGYRGNGRMLCHGCSKGARTRARKRITEEQVGKWKRGGIIGAAALTGGALLAITGGRTEFPIIYLLTYKHTDSSLGHTSPRRLICSQ